MRNKRMQPYGGSATKRKLPDPNKAVRGDGKPGGDAELGHQARQERYGDFEDGSGRWERGGTVYTRDAETQEIRSEGDFRQHKGESIEERRRRKFEEEKPGNRKKSKPKPGETIVVA